MHQITVSGFTVDVVRKDIKNLPQWRFAKDDLNRYPLTELPTTLLY